jgi:5,5'-dehydrodivanillate O-demethylase
MGDPMNAPVPAPSRAEQLKLLTQTTRDTEMGRLLRMFWHPVALSKDIGAGQAIPVKAFGEELTLYRGESGKPHLVGGRCRHRQTVLHTGWVQGDTIRCMYHGWQYEGSGAACSAPPRKRPPFRRPARSRATRCTNTAASSSPSWARARRPNSTCRARTSTKPPGARIVATRETWNINWFQQIENSLDATHVSFVHRAPAGRPLRRCGDVGHARPLLSETEAGIEQTARRGEDNIRKSNWTFPTTTTWWCPACSRATRGSTSASGWCPPTTSTARASRCT